MEVYLMEKNFNNYNLSNLEIEKILKDFEPQIRQASKIDGKYDEDCQQKIRIALFRKLSRNRKK